VLDALAHSIVESDLLTNGNLLHGNKSHGRASEASIGVARVVRVVGRLGVAAHGKSTSTSKTAYQKEKMSQSSR
jgi:hypothetical protein